MLKRWKLSQSTALRLLLGEARVCMHIHRGLGQQAAEPDIRRNVGGERRCRREGTENVVHYGEGRGHPLQQFAFPACAEIFTLTGFFSDWNRRLGEVAIDMRRSDRYANFAELARSPRTAGH